MLGRVAIWLSFALMLSAADQFPDGDGKKIVEKACVSCHATATITDKHWDQAKWTQVVKATKGHDTLLKDDDAARAVAYLTKNFGPDRGQELVEGICTLCHELTRVKKQQYAKEEWEGTIRGMIEEGAPVTDQEFILIVNYLTKNYGPQIPDSGQR